MPASLGKVGERIVRRLGRRWWIAQTEINTRTDPEDEAADMRPPGYLPGVGVRGVGFQRYRAREILLGNPKDQKQNGWNAKAKQEKEQETNLALGKHHEIGTHDGRDCSASPHGRNSAAGIKINMGEMSREPPEQIKKEGIVT